MSYSNIPVSSSIGYKAKVVFVYITTCSMFSLTEVLAEKVEGLKLS